ncbi:MAG: RDD family protein [Spirochaetes bacterium]|nr:RDD family protein [Spirochaetota bacterium]
MFSDHFGNPIELDSASIFSRGCAYVLDRIFLGIFWFLLIMLIVILDKLGLWDFLSSISDSVPLNGSSGDKLNEIAMTIIISLLVFLAYAVFLFPVTLAEFIMSGRSPGKLICGIRIISENGERPSFFQVFMRAILRDIESMFGLIFILATPRRQTFYDILCSTVVKNVRKKKINILEANAAKSVFVLDYKYQAKAILWQRYYFAMIPQIVSGNHSENYIVTKLIKVLIDNIPAMKNRFAAEDEDSLSRNKRTLEDFSTALDKGGIQWVSR